MTDPHRNRKDDTSEYAPSKAPDTREHAEEAATERDNRLMPGGAHGTDADPGMSSLDRDEVPSGARADEKKQSS